MGEFQFCEDFVSNSGSSALQGGILRAFEASMFLLQIFYLNWWQKWNQKLALEGDEVSADAVVLPVYGRLLNLTTLILFFRSLLFFLSPFSDPDHPGYIFLWAFGYIFFQGLEATMWVFLLLQRSSGKLAVLRALLISIVWSLYITSFWIGALVSSSPWNDVCLILHYGTFLILHLTIYIYLVLFPRPRDSLKTLLLFWIITQSCYVTWLILEVSLDGELIDCMYLVSEVPQTLFYPYILYKTLRIDSRYWRKLGKVAQAKTIFSGAHNTTLGVGMADPSKICEVTKLYESLSEDTREIENLLSLHACLYDFAQIAVIKDLDRGASAIVRLCKYKGKYVALKTFTCRELTAEMIQVFCKEVFISTKVSRHPNVCRLEGVCICPPRVSLVLEYCSEGSLKSLLRDENRDLPWSLRLKFALHSARGICYLHSERIVHRDLKSSNILIHKDEKGELIAKVADFGEARGEATIISSLSPSTSRDDSNSRQSIRSSPSPGSRSNASQNQIISVENLMTTTVGTPNYSAPELMTSEQQYSRYTRAVDCYSYGIILWEIYTREIPWKGLRYYQVRVALEEGKRPIIPQECPPDFASLIEVCWHEQPSKRPEFASIVSFLEVMLFRLETNNGQLPLSSSSDCDFILPNTLYCKSENQPIQKKSAPKKFQRGASEGALYGSILNSFGASGTLDRVNHLPSVVPLEDATEFENGSNPETLPRKFSRFFAQYTNQTQNTTITSTTTTTTTNTPPITNNPSVNFSNPVSFSIINSSRQSEKNQEEKRLLDSSD